MISNTSERVYVAPELMQGPAARPTAQTDIYSLGVVFFQLLTGVLPDQHQGTGHPRPPRAIDPQVPAELEAICLKGAGHQPCRAI